MNELLNPNLHLTKSVLSLIYSHKKLVASTQECNLQIRDASQRASQKNIAFPRGGAIEILYSPFCEDYSLSSIMSLCLQEISIDMILETQALMREISDNSGVSSFMFFTVQRTE